MTDRADRIRDRRNQASEKAHSEPSKPSEPDETDETGEQSVKDEQVGTYLYLPEAQKQAMGYQYKLLSAEYEREFGEPFEKNRHFYPLIVKHGLDSLDGCDAQELQKLLDGLEY